MVEANTIRALGEVQNHMPAQQGEVTGYYAGITMQELAAQLGIPEHAIWFYSVNGNKVNPTYRLQPGETVTIHGPVDGG